MNMLRVISSHSQQRLVRALAEHLITVPAPPLEREAVIVLSNGMARWLSMEIATLHGVSAGLEYHFPNDLLDRCFRAVLPDIPVQSPFTPDAMAWRIARILPARAQEPGFEQISAYLGDSRDDRRLLQLARVIADSFDQYTIFRPELLQAWDRGEGSEWQARLWRSISSGHTGLHRAALLERFARRIPQLHARPAGIPARISLIGISYLPPFHLQALALLSRVCEISCYLLNPCGEYWGNLISARDLSRLALRGGSELAAPEHYETGNPLLSSLGTLGQEFFESLLDFGFTSDMLEEGCDTGWGPAQQTTLGMVQQDILGLHDRTTAAADKGVLRDDDHSILIHSCHGPLREMEILYDQLLAMFNELPDLEPRQIVVMIPDIESYVPYITAVFANRSGSRPPLPFSIADRSNRRESPYIQAFLNVLTLAESRFGVNEIFSLLEMGPVMARFNFAEDEITAIRSWLTECGVRWGLDAGQRAELGFEPYADFSWQSGLERLFLGYALPHEQDVTFKGILPAPGVEGRQALPLGRLADFIAASRAARTVLRQRHTPGQWADLLARLADQLLLAGDQDDRGHAATVKALNVLRDAETSNGFDHPLGLAAVRDLLGAQLEQGGSGYGFMGGGITFCAMLPMRSIPMRVICLAGMNDGVFPRTSRPPGFSHMSGQRRRGDRSLRDEDRYLFLEALMSAQERLCISYCGQSERDNSVIPPSILVSELADYIRKGFVGSTGAEPQPVVRHRLQGFSSAYFDAGSPGQLFSFDQETCAALTARQQAGEQSGRIFLHTPLPIRTEQTIQVELVQLRRFLASPAAFFLSQRLKLQPYDPAEEGDEREPFALDGLEAYALRQELVGRFLAGESAAAACERARSRAQLPPLALGTACFDKAWARAVDLGRALQPLLSDVCQPLPFELQLRAVRLTGTLEHIMSDRHVLWRDAALKGKDRLNIWLDHLLLNTLQADGFPRDSIVVGTGQQITLPPLADAAPILEDLLRLYADGLTRPLPFFPQTSWLYLAEGVDKARQRWSGDDFSGSPPESASAAHSICFGHEDPLIRPEFRTLAERIFSPYRAVAVEGKTA